MPKILISFTLVLTSSLSYGVPAFAQSVQSQPQSAKPKVVQPKVQRPEWNEQVQLFTGISQDEFKTILTLNTPNSRLYNEGDGRSAIDHWVLLDSREQWPTLPWSGPGDLWSYTSCNTGSGNTPEWLVDYPPINERIQAGSLNWTQQATGILYYRSDGWTSGNTIDSWNNVDKFGCDDNSRPGDGIFLYPPGPIASSEAAPGIRLKSIRDGVQDYEYAHILRNLGQDAFVNSTIQPVATSWTNWKNDPNAMESARMQLGQMLNQLSPP